MLEGVKSAGSQSPADNEQKFQSLVCWRGEKPSLRVGKYHRFKFQSLVCWRVLKALRAEEKHRRRIVSILGMLEGVKSYARRN